VYQLDDKVFYITDARCKHEDCLRTCSVPVNTNTNRGIHTTLTATLIFLSNLITLKLKFM